MTGAAGRERRSGIRGQGLVEYALILVLIAIVVIVVLAIIGPAVANVYSEVTDELSAEDEGGGSSPGGGGSGGAEGGEDCYGSGLLPYLLGLTGLVSLLFRPAVPGARLASRDAA